MSARAAQRIAAALAPGLALGLWALAAAWVLSIPPSLSSDDALHFLRALTRFSVLEFSPQFPGYPGFVAMGRLVLRFVPEPLAALGLLGAGLALLIPFAAAAAAWKAGAGRGAALCAFVLALACPLGPDLALSLLSDGAGVAFTLVGIAALPRRPVDPGAPRASFRAGLAFGWALACRPTNLALVGAAALGAFLAAPRRMQAGFAGGALVLCPCFALLLVIEPLFLVEAERFIAGHATLWGNTAFTEGGGASWGEVLAAHPFIAALLAVEAVGCLALALDRRAQSRPARLALAFGFAGHAAWCLAFQNPESLRHLAPVLLLGAVGVASCGPRRWGGWPAACAGAVSVIALGGGVYGASDAPPLQRVASLAHQSERPPTLITNHGVHLLRDALPAIRVHDAHYQGASALAAKIASPPVWRITSTPPVVQDLEVTPLPGRWPGERDMYLVVLKKSDGG